jgi:hypothetical protein
MGSLDGGYRRTCVFRLSASHRDAHNRISSTSRIPLDDLSLASSSMRFVYR